MTEHQIGLGEYLARLPYRVGHELGDDYVVVGALGTDDRTIATAAIEWAFPLSDPDAAKHCAQHLARALRGEEVGRLMIVGYGPAGPGRSRLIARELHQATDATTMQVHIQDGTWRARGLTGPWSTAVALPRVATETGQPDLAASKEDLRASMAPMPSPSFGSPTPATVARLKKLSPALRAEVACRALDNLASGTGNRTAQMQLLAHLVTTDVITRDAVLGHALDGTDTQARVKALVQTFRSAPTEKRHALATLAATAAYLAAWNPPLVRALLTHAEPHAGLTNLVAQAVEAGVNPHTLRPGLVRAARDGLTDADQAWTAKQGQRPDGPTVAEKNPKPQTAPPAPPHAARPAQTSTPEL